MFFGLKSYSTCPNEFEKGVENHDLEKFQSRLKYL